MRKLVTFIVRLWVDPQVEPPAWEGQVECIAGGDRAHVRGPQEIVRFIEAHALIGPGEEPSPADAEHWPVTEPSALHVSGHELKRSAR